MVTFQAVSMEDEYELVSVKSISTKINLTLASFSIFGLKHSSCPSVRPSVYRLHNCVRYCIYHLVFDTVSLQKNAR